MSLSQRPFFLWLGFCFALFLTACSSNTSTNPASESPTHAWLWAFDDEGSQVTVYDADEGTQSAHMTASAFSKMHVMIAGSSKNPTLWMANDDQAYALTYGFDFSGTSPLRTTPAEYATLAVGSHPVHMGRSPSGDTVAFANDGDQTLSIIDVQQKKVVQTLSHGSGHSSALIANGYALTTAATGSGETWAKIVSIAADSVLDSLTIGSGAHGHAYHAEQQKALIACANGIYIIDLKKRSVTGSIAYTQEGRTNFLYHGEQNAMAIGLHKTEAGTSDKILLLNMETESLDYLQISGATLNWHLSQGQFALSENGNVAVLSDLEKNLVYVVDLSTQEIITLNAPAKGSAVATNFDGSIVWSLSDHRISVLNVASNQIQDQFSVAAETDWIYITSPH